MMNTYKKIVALELNWGRRGGNKHFSLPLTVPITLYISFRKVFGKYDLCYIEISQEIKNFQPASKLHYSFKPS